MAEDIALLVEHFIKRYAARYRRSARAIAPEALASLPYGQRKRAIVDAINGLGPAPAVEQPHPGDPGFAARVRAHQAETGVRQSYAVLAEVLRDSATCPESSRVAPGVSLTDSASDRWLATLRQWLYGT